MTFFGWGGGLKSNLELISQEAKPEGFVELLSTMIYKVDYVYNSEQVPVFRVCCTLVQNTFHASEVSFY